jgi:hypothetical protein
MAGALHNGTYGAIGNAQAMTVTDSGYGGLHVRDLLLCVW